MTTSSTNNSSTLRIGVLANIGTLDPREMGDTITGLVLGQIFEMAYRVTPSGAIEPHLFAEPLRQERAGNRLFSRGARGHRLLGRNSAHRRDCSGVARESGSSSRP